MKPVLGYVFTLLGSAAIFCSTLGAGDHLPVRGSAKHATVVVAGAAGAGALVAGWAWLRTPAERAARRADDD